MSFKSRELEFVRYYHTGFAGYMVFLLPGYPQRLDDYVKGSFLVPCATGEGRYRTACFDCSARPLNLLLLETNNPTEIKRKTYRLVFHWQDISMNWIVHESSGFHVFGMNNLGKVYYPMKDGFDKENIQKKLRISFFLAWIIHQNNKKG